jgi:hypothetical protein
MNPPLVAFSPTCKKLSFENVISYYDPISQKSIYPFGLGSQKVPTGTTRNIGSIQHPIWKWYNTDDAIEK